MSNVKSSKMQNSIQPSGIKRNKDAAARRNLLNKMFLSQFFHFNRNVPVGTADRHDANLQLLLGSDISHEGEKVKFRNGHNGMVRTVNKAKQSGATLALALVTRFPSVQQVTEQRDPNTGDKLAEATGVLLNSDIWYHGKEGGSASAASCQTASTSLC